MTVATEILSAPMKLASGIKRMVAPGEERRFVLAVAAVLVLTFMFRLPSLFEPPWYDDEGIYAAVASSWLNGQELYSEVLDNRPPGLYFIYAAIIATFGPKLIFIKLAATMSVLASQLCVVKIGEDLWGRKVGLIAAALLGLLSGLPLLEGNIANAEIFMMFPVSLGMLLRARRKDFASGLAFGTALTVKQIAGAELAAALLAGALFAPLWKRRTSSLMAGFSIPLIAMLAYVVIYASFWDFIFANVSYYLGYVQRETRIPPASLFLKISLLLLTVVLMKPWLSGKRSDRKVSLAVPPLWLAFSFFGAVLTGRPYVHYMLSFLPPLCLLLVATGPVLRAPDFRRAPWGKVAATFTSVGASAWLLFAIFIPWPGWASPERVAGYYGNHAQFLVGLKSRAAFNDFFDKRVNRNLEVASYLANRARKGDSLLVWGDEPWIYALSSLPLPDMARVTVSYFAYEIPNGLKDVAASVKMREPTFIVLVTNKPLYPELKEALDSNYIPSKTVGSITVLERPPRQMALQGRAATPEFNP